MASYLELDGYDNNQGLANDLSLHLLWTSGYQIQQFFESANRQVLFLILNDRKMYLY